VNDTTRSLAEEADAYLNDMDYEGKPAPFQHGDRVLVGPLSMVATVVRQRKCYDGPDVFWGNVELLYDDGIKGVSNSWQLKKL